MPAIVFAGDFARSPAPAPARSFARKTAAAKGASLKEKRKNLQYGAGSVGALQRSALADVNIQPLSSGLRRVFLCR